METKSSKNEQLEKVRELIEDIRIGMLTTVNEENWLVSRPMAVQQIDEDGTLWFFSSRSAPKVEQIEQNERQVNVSFTDVGNASYVSVAGIGHEVDNRAMIDELWNPMAKAWFPKGKDDPELILLRVQIQMAEYWDASASMMVRLFQQASALLTGKQPDMGDHEKVYK